QPYMDHPGEEFIFVQQGTVEVEIPTQVITLAEGDSLYFDSSTPHRVRSVSAERAVGMVVVYDRVDDVDAKTLRRRCGPTAWRDDRAVHTAGAGCGVPGSPAKPSCGRPGLDSIRQGDAALGGARGHLLGEDVAQQIQVRAEGPVGRQFGG